MRVISHRGAKGYGDENSINTIKIAAQLKIDYIEFDIQYTKNNVIILQHDLETPKGKPIKDHSFRELQRDISYMTTLRDALREAEGKPVIIESKAPGTYAKALDILKTYPNAAFASSIPEEILSARIHLPKQKTFYIKGNPPFGLVKTSKKIDASGIGMNYLWLPFVFYYYLKARQNNLDMYVYTINSYFIAKILTTIMPKLYIVTDQPKKMIKTNE